MSLESKNTPPAAPEGDDYLERRALRRGSAGWVLLTGLGVAYVVSGDYSGWNFGLAEGGFGGLAIAMVLMGTMYACMVFALGQAEVPAGVVAGDDVRDAESGQQHPAGAAAAQGSAL